MFRVFKTFKRQKGQAIADWSLAVLALVGALTAGMVFTKRIIGNQLNSAAEFVRANDGLNGANTQGWFYYESENTTNTDNSTTGSTFEPGKITNTASGTTGKTGTVETLGVQNN